MPTSTSSSVRSSYPRRQRQSLHQRGSSMVQLLVVIGLFGIFVGITMMGVERTIYKEFRDGASYASRTSLNNNLSGRGGGVPGGSGTAGGTLGQTAGTSVTPGTLAAPGRGGPAGANGIKATGNGGGTMTPTAASDDLPEQTVFYGNGIIIQGSKDFVDGVLSDMKKLESTVSGQTLLGNIGASGKSVTIREITPEEREQGLSDHVDPASWPDSFPAGAQIPGTNGGVIDGTGVGSDAEVVLSHDIEELSTDRTLFHELQHASNATHGTMNHRTVGDETVDGPWHSREEKVVMQGGWINDETYAKERQGQGLPGYDKSPSTHDGYEWVDHGSQRSVYGRQRVQLRHEIGQLEERQFQAADQLNAAQNGTGGRNKITKITRAKSVFESTSDQLAAKRQELVNLEQKQQAK